MKKIIIGLSLSLLIFSCSTKSKGNFTLTGEIKGLKKGVVYLEKLENNKIVVIDSVFINDGTETFTFSNNIIEPELYILSLDKLNTKQISFFGEPGEMNIKTSLDNFFIKATVLGSPLNDLLEEHDNYTKRINDKSLDLIKDKFEAQKQGDQAKVDEIENKKLQNLKRLYLFSANYAIAHKNTAIAPFIAYTRMKQATPQLKQQIYDALTSEIKESKYGKLLKESLI